MAWVELWIYGLFNSDVLHVSRRLVYRAELPELGTQIKRTPLCILMRRLYHFLLPNLSLI